MRTTWGGMGIKRYKIDGVNEPLVVLINAKRREKGKYAMKMYKYGSPLTFVALSMVLLWHYY